VGTVTEHPTGSAAIATASRRGGEVPDRAGDEYEIVLERERGDCVATRTRVDHDVGTVSD
jgi:hypothetical protein